MKKLLAIIVGLVTGGISIVSQMEASKCIILQLRRSLVPCQLINLLGLRLRENQCCIHMKKIFRSIVDAMTKTVSISPLGLVLYSPESISRQN